MSYRFHATQTLGPSARPSTCEASLDYRFRNLPPLARNAQEQSLLASLRAPVAPGQIVPRRTSVTVGTSLLGAFGGFSEAPTNVDELNAAMTTVVQALRDAYAQGQKKIDDAKGTGFVNFITGSSETEASIQGAYNQIRPLIDKLDTTLRQQVLDGQRPDGTPYTVDDWKSFAVHNIGDDIKSQVGYSWDSSGLAVLQATYNKTVADVAKDASIGLGAVAGLAALAGGAYLLVVTGTAGSLLTKLFKRHPKTAMAGFVAGAPRRKSKSKSKAKRHSHAHR